MIKYAGYIIAAAAVIIAAIAIYKKERLAAWLNKEENREKIKALIRRAERWIVGTEQGQNRLSWVVGEVIKLLPAALQKNVDAEKIILIINLLFAQIRVKTPDGHTKAI